MNNVKKFWQKKGPVIKQHFFNFCFVFLKKMKSEKWLFSFIAVLITCILSIIFIDKPFALYLKEHLGRDTEGFFKTITGLGLMGWWFGIFGIFWLGFSAAAGVSLTTEDFEKYMSRSRSFLFMLTSLAASAITVTVLKIIIGRLRPRYLFSDDLYGFSPFNFNFAMNSFPSGHSISIFTAMFSLMMVFPRYDAAYILLAGLIAVSRVATTVHYLSDVIMACYLAFAIVSCVKEIFEEGGEKVQIKCERDKLLG